MNLRTAVHLLPTPTTRDHKGRNQRDDDSCLPGAVREDRWGRYAEAVALWEQVTDIPAPEPTVEAPRGGRRLNPDLPEWMMGHPRGFLTSRLTRNEALKAAGNGVVVRQAAAAWERLA